MMILMHDFCHYIMHNYINYSSDNRCYRQTLLTEALGGF